MVRPVPSGLLSHLQVCQESLQKILVVNINYRLQNVVQSLGPLTVQISREYFGYQITIPPTPHLIMFTLFSWTAFSSASLGLSGALPM